MKRLAILIMAFLLVMILCACGDSRSTFEGEEIGEGQVIQLPTPYADISVPKEFEKNVVSEVIEESPYTVIFKTKTDGTELFTLYFDDSGNILMGTLIGENENTVVSFDLADLDASDKYYEKNCVYQEAVNTILSHFVTDQNFAVNEVVIPEDTSIMMIETPYVALQYPSKWKDYVRVSMEEDTVRFFNEDVPLFDLIFGETDGYCLGTYRDIPLYIVDYPVETDEQAAMQDDVNVILQHLQEDADFTIRN